jgi:hypothetical protein
VEKVDWINKFTTNVSYLLTSEKWKSSANEFLITILAGENYSSVKAQIDDLIHIYQEENLTTEKFVTPLELLSKVLSKTTGQLSQRQSDLIDIIAQKHLSTTDRISKENVN